MGSSAASFCRQVAALVPDMCFANFMLLKTSKLLLTQQPLKLDKNKHRFGILRIFDVFLTIFENDEILLNKISHRFLVTTKLFGG